MKKTRSGGVESELAADRFLDFTKFAAKFFGEQLEGVTSLKALGDFDSRNPRAYDDRSTKGDGWLDRNDARSLDRDSLTR